jgi:hypothetical protein
VQKTDPGGETSVTAPGLLAFIASSPAGHSQQFVWPNALKQLLELTHGYAEAASYPNDGDFAASGCRIARVLGKAKILLAGCGDMSFGFPRSRWSSGIPFKISKVLTFHAVDPLVTPKH